MQKTKQFQFMAGMMCALTLAFGGYYEFISGLFAAILFVGFAYEVVVKKVAMRHLTDSFFVGVILFLGYGIVCFYAVDSGMAVQGFVKKSLFFAVALWLLFFQKKEKENLLKIVPYIGAVMCVTCYIAYFIPWIKDYVINENRLSGWFQYANTCGLFLLVGFILLMLEEHKTKWQWGIIVLLLSGILLTGSRSTMLLLAVAVIMLFVSCKEQRKILFVATIGVVVVVAGVVLITGNTNNIGRITTAFSQSSTWYGRMLYSQDGAVTVYHNPLGLGYLGFYYMQNAVQTGLYTVRYIHNDWLQIGLDIGTVPMLLVLFFVAKGILSKEQSKGNRIVLIMLFLHCLVDFNMEYSVIGILVLLCLDPKEYKWSIGKKLKMGISLAVVLVSLFNIYMAVPLIARSMDKTDVALKCYPWDTESRLVQLSKEESEKKVEKLAQRILKQNKTCALAYDAKGIIAMNNGDYDQAIANMKKAIYYNRFSKAEYDQLQWLLEQLVQMEGGDIYQKDLEDVIKLRKTNQDKVSYLGRQIKDKVEITNN